MDKDPRSVVFSSEDNFDELQNTIMQYQDVAEKSIGEVLKGDGANTIMDEIKINIHPSGRKWKGKPRSSKLSKSLQIDKKETTDLELVIRTPSKYGYLYFPDDGTNTEHHAGEQYFMLRGAETKASTVLQMCVENIIKNANK